jgi:hypothetical protein
MVYTDAIPCPDSRQEAPPGDTGLDTATQTAIMGALDLLCSCRLSVPRSGGLPCPSFMRNRISISPA